MNLNITLTVFISVLCSTILLLACLVWIRVKHNIENIQSLSKRANKWNYESRRIPQTASPECKYYLELIGNRANFISENVESIDIYNSRFYIAIKKGVTLFGRNKAACDYVINNVYASRIHFKIDVTRNEPLIVNLATNGTCVNGNKITTCKLVPGDIISVQDTAFLFDSFELQK